MTGWINLGVGLHVVELAVQTRRRNAQFGSGMLFPNLFRWEVVSGLLWRKRAFLVACHYGRILKPDFSVCVSIVCTCLVFVLLDICSLVITENMNILFFEVFALLRGCSFAFFFWAHVASKYYG